MIDKGLIDFVLQYRAAIKAAVDEEKENRDANRKVGGNGSGHCRISDPTAQKAIKHLDPIGTVKVYYGPYINGQRAYRIIHDAEKWLSIADATWKHFSDTRYGKFMELRYGDDKGIKAIRTELHIGRRRFFYLQKDVRMYAYRAAKGMHVNADARPFFNRTAEIMSVIAKADNSNGG